LDAPDDVTHAGARERSERRRDDVDVGALGALDARGTTATRAAAAGIVVSRRALAGNDTRRRARDRVDTERRSDEARMTTAHRPTWAPAKGREHQGGARLFGPSAKHSKLDANGFMTMKTRAPSQGGADALLARDLKRELEEKERAAKGGKTGAGRAIGEAGTAAPALALGGDDDEGRFKPRAEDADDDASASGSENDSESDSESDGTRAREEILDLDLDDDDARD
jgi:hypothetical protein